MCVVEVDVARVRVIGRDIRVSDEAQASNQLEEWREG